MNQLPLGLPTGEATPPDSRDWQVLAYRCIRDVAERMPLVHVDDVARHAEETQLPRPANMNSWGAVWRKAVGMGLLELTTERRPAGGTLRRHRHKHGRSYPVYKSRVFQP